MPIITDDRQINSAVQFAAGKPFEGIDPGFIARFNADYGARVDGENADARERTRIDLQDEYIKQFYQVSGQRLNRWLGGAGVNPIAEREAAAKAQVDQWRKANPNVDLPEFPTTQKLEEQAEGRARTAISGSKDLSRRSTSWGSSIGGFLGTAAGAMSDPINMLSMPFGAHASGVLRTALIEGGIAAGSEAVSQGINMPFRQRVDPDYSASTALSEVAAAGVGGAAVGGGLKGLAALWSRARTGQWPSHIRDAANVVTREAAVPSSRYQPSLAGETAHVAAYGKAADDLAKGRPVELPPEAFVEANARPARVFDADGNSVGVRYEVVEADSLVTSNLDDMTVNPAFPQELQPRDRTRAMSQDQIAGIAGNLQPERLGFSPQAETGAPIVGPDGIVESGNGRVLALRRVMQENGPQAQSYRNFLRAQNFDLEGFRNPVLIARRVTDLEDRVAFVTAANRSTSMRLGAAEQAMSDARLIDGGMLDLIGKDRQAFNRTFMGKLPRAEQGSLIDKDGFLSQEGERRITAALMGRAYGEPALLARVLEDTDNNIKSLGGAMADSAGTWSRMRDAVTKGEIPAGMDITSDLLNAVRMVMKARDEGRAMRDLVNQAEMFGGPDELSKIVARALFSDADLKRPAGRAKVAAFLDDFASEAMKNDAGPRLFGAALDATDILKSSLERAGRSDLHRIAEERLTPEAVTRLEDDPAVADVSIMDGERLIADREEAINRQRRWERESARLLKDGAGEIPNALYHHDVGPIDVIWGAADPSSMNKAFGLSKIALKHPEVLENLPSIIERMDVAQRTENRIRLSSDSHRAVVRLDLDGEKKTWLMTAFEFDGRRAGKTTDRPGDLQGGGHSSPPSSTTSDIVQELRGSKPEPIMVDLGDGRGERDLADILREADEEIAAGKEIEGCAIGKAADE